MPVAAGGHYRMGAHGIRLHYTKAGKVDETKNMKTGATHTPAEFKADRARTTLSGRKRG